MKTYKQWPGEMGAVLIVRNGTLQRHDCPRVRRLGLPGVLMLVGVLIAAAGILAGVLTLYVEGSAHAEASDRLCRP